MKKILFSLVALVCSMSMNAQVMKIMKGNVVVATYTAEQADNVVFEEAPAVADPFGWQEGSTVALMDGTNHSKYNYVSGDGNTLSSFALAEGQTAVSGANIYALYPYAVGTTSVTRPATQADAEAAAGRYSDEVRRWKDRCDRYDPMRKEDYLNMLKEDMTEEMGISAENQTIIIAYLKGENATVVTPGVELEGEMIKNVFIPAEQIVAEGQAADPQAMLKVAKGDGDNLAFADVCAYIKVTPQFDCTAICITSKGNEQLAGKVNVNYNGGEPTTTVTANGTNTVYLVGTITSGNAYYIAVRPEALASGYTIEFLTADKGYYYAQSTGNALALESGEVNDLGEFSATSTWNTATPTLGNDGAGHNWILVTPTLKVQALTTLNAKIPYADIPTWAGWSLPEADELFNAINAGVFTATWSKTTIKGIGILKYGNSIEIEEGQDYYWTSTEQDSENQWGVGMVNKGKFYTKKTSNLTYIFKYNN